MSRVAGTVSLSCQAFSENQMLLFPPFLALFWQSFHAQPARTCMPTSIPSQIAVDCKSVHLILESELGMDRCMYMGLVL